jgi:hypothetical protein
MRAHVREGSSSKQRGLRGLAAAVASLLVAGSAWAQAAAPAVVTVDRAAGLIIYPKIVSDPSGLLSAPVGIGPSVDTVIQLTNTSSTDTTLECFYVDATSHCSNGGSIPDPVGGACRTGSDCNPGGVCAPQWVETDFPLELTANQSIGWQASTGIQTTGLCTKAAAGDPPFPQLGQPCGSSAECGAGVCTALPVGSITPLSPGVFQGELKCIQVNDSTANLPVNRNDLVGTATIYDVTLTSVDTRSYNAIGIQAVSSNGATQTDTTLCLGTNNLSGECAVADYAQCPATLILDHYFDGAHPVTGTTVTTDVTFVPCSENLENGVPQPVTQLQFLVFNEFEQRFSTDGQLDCFLETQLSHIDRRPGQESASVFNVAVQGTATGQTRVRPVQNGQVGVGNGVLAVLEEFRTDITGTHSAAYNVNYTGVAANRGDFIRYLP